MKVEYQNSPLGNIPINWQVVKLSEICDVRDGTHDSPKYVDNGIPFVTSKNLTDTTLSFDNIKYISNEDHLSFSKRSHVENGDILFGMIGTVGKPIIVEEDFEFSIKNVALLKFSDNIVLNNTFAKNVLKSSLVLNQFKKISNGGVLNFVALGNIRSLDFPVPPLPEQQKIADILNTVDAKIKVIDQQITVTEELKKGLMQHLFTKGIGHTEFKDSLLGEIPMSWDVSKLVEVTKSYAGGTPKRSVKEYYNGTIPWIKSGEVNNNNIVSCSEYVTELAINESSAKLIEPNSILVALYGATAGKVGVLKIEACSNQAVLAIKSTVNFLTNDFLYHYLKKCTEELLNLCQGSGQPNLSKGIVDSVNIPIPPTLEQKKIVNVFNSIDERIKILEEKKTNYDELKQGLMQQLLTGKIRVNNLVEA